MISAAQAKVQTMERINQIAKEFIINCAEPAIDEAIKEGKFKATPSFEGVINPEITGAEVVRILTCDHGYEAKHVLINNQRDHANYIRIEWGTN